MEVYDQAGCIVHAYLNYEGSLRSLCLQRDVQRKKQTYALACETVRNLQLLDAVIQASGLHNYRTIFKRKILYGSSLLRVVAYELLMGKGLRSLPEPCNIIRKFVKKILKVYKIMKNDPRYATNDTSRSDKPCRINLRVNNLKAEKSREYYIDLFRGVGDKLFSDLFSVDNTPAITHHPLVKKGHLMIQSRVSCLPAHCVFEAIGHFRNVVDACSSPGNKTSHLCSLYAEKLQERDTCDLRVIALEKDRLRYCTLRDRIQLLSASSAVTCVHGDFLDFYWPLAEVIVCDPSCSANKAIGSDRLLKLVKFQVRLLCHALLNFPAARCVAYSTCSANPMENELVVAIALSITQSKKWNLHHAIPSWNVRGIPLDDAMRKDFATLRRSMFTIDTNVSLENFFTDQHATHCLRSEEPTPFFVALFVRHDVCT